MSLMTPSPGDTALAAPAREVRWKVVALCIVLVGVTLDLWLKAFMADWLGMTPKVPGSLRHYEVIPGFLRWEGNWNAGITFGLAQGWTYWILAFTVVASLGIAAWIVLTRSRSRLFHVGLSLILAGALGNLYDRFQWQEVRDFVVVYWKDPSIWQWPAFNLADSMIVVGVGLILWLELFGRRPVPASPRTAP